MFCEITKIIPPKKSQTEGNYMTIQMKDIKTEQFYQTYIVAGYRNYNRWRKVAQISNQIFFRNLKIKTGNIIDADSWPLLLAGKREKAEPVKLDDKSLAEAGVFGAIFLFICL